MWLLWVPPKRFFTRATWRNILENGILHNQRRENVKSYVSEIILRDSFRALRNQCPMVCFEPHTTQRSSNSVRTRRNKEMFHHISQPTNTTRKQSGHRIKQPATRQTKTKRAVALRPHSRERRREITAHNSISDSVYRRVITGWFLRISVNPEHIYLLIRFRVDCKFAKENKKFPGLRNQEWTSVARCGLLKTYPRSCASFGVWA
jgi:hypothetical protein